MMADYRLLKNHILFTELFKDALGVNYRGGTVVDRKVGKHRLIEVVDSVFSSDKETWKKIKILLEGVKKSNVLNFFSPQEIITPEQEQDEVLLIFDNFVGRTCEQIINESQAQQNPMPFDLVFAIIQNAAEIIDLGSTIVIAGEKSFHGLLTPDNILVSFEGKITLKNYGIFPYIDIHKNPVLHAELEKKYGGWLAPESVRRERVMPQSDVYHLGYLAYVMLTGKYFTLSEGEDFEQKLSSLSFKHLLPQNDKEFLDSILFFFRRTLNPDPQKRFQNARELKAFINSHFHLDELSTQTFNLAYFMNSLYGAAMEADEKAIQAEMNYSLPEPKKEAVPSADTSPLRQSAPQDDSKLVASLLESLDEKKKGSKWIYAVAGGAGLVVLVVLGFYFSQAGKTKQLEAEQLKRDQEIQTRMAETNKQYEAQMEELKRSFEQQRASTEEERKAQEEQLARQLEQLQRQQQLDIARAKAQEEAQEQEEQRRREEDEAAEAERQRQQEEARQRAEEEERQRQEELQRRQLEESQRVKEGDTVGIDQLTVKPEKTGGADPVVSDTLRRKYSGNTYLIMSQVLINENGRVENVRVIGNHPEDLKNLVRSTLQRWQYTIPQKDGIKVKVWQTVPIRFSF